MATCQAVKNLPQMGDFKLKYMFTALFFSFSFAYFSYTFVLSELLNH